MQTVTRNAGEELARHRLRRASDHDSRARALESLQRELACPTAPLRIECYDMSHLQGTDYVGSMVVLEDGLPQQERVPALQVRDVPGNDDYAAMEEVLTRRLTALLERPGAGDQRAQPNTGRPTATGRPPRRGAPGRGASPTRPSCCSSTAGKGQLGVGVRVLEQLGLTERSPSPPWPRRFEEVYLPGRADPLRLPRHSEALYLLQRSGTRPTASPSPTTGISGGSA